ncbi:MAG: CidA/LrgA family protein [Cardiobacteriaceae bacterium]|nr:CidA/LrgA family protein [Cardiobacteriaceae bacterium]
MIRALGIVIGCWWLGELLVWLLDLALPPSVLGLLVLFGLLNARVVDEMQIKALCDFCLQHMMLFLIPPCVGLIQYLGLLKIYGVQVVLATVLSTSLVFIVSAKAYEYIRKKT